jgi:diguanylate cyclase (GGDEF)-like protein/PAS domain S-box-containing protein
MKTRLIPLLLRLKGWRLSTIVTFSTMLGAAVVVSIMDLILKGEVTADYLITGLVTAAIVAPPSLMLLSHLLHEIAVQQHAALSASVNRAEARLNVALESTDEGMLMVGSDGSLLATNARFLELWRVPQQLADVGQDEPLLAHVLDQLVDPEHFLAQVRRLYDSNEEARDTLQFKDGRVFARYTRALSFGCEQGRIWCFKDITEQAQSELALIASYKLLQTIIDTAPVRIFWKDRDLRYLGCNPLFAMDAGLKTAAELIGKDDYQMTWADQADLYRMDDRAVMESGVAKLAYEEPQTTPDGREIWLRTSKIPLKDADNQVIGILGVYEDISERKQLADALRQREKYQRALLDTFPFMVWLKDEQSRFLAVNQAFAIGFGWPSAQSLIGKSDVDIAPPDLAARYQADDRAVLDSGQSKNVEELIEIAGRRVWFETYKSPVSIDGRIIGTVGFARDISDRKRTELNLNMAAEVAQMLFWECDLLSGRLIYDQSMLPVLGLEVEDGLVSLPRWLERVHPDDQSAFAASFELAMQPGDPIFDCEYRMFDRSGRYQWLHTRGRVIQRAAQGQPALAVGTSMNITPRKQIEAAMRVSEERSHNLAALLRLMCDNVPDMIWAKDLESRYLFANKAICEQLLNAGDTEEPVGKNDMFFAQRERDRHVDNPQWHTFGELCQDSDAVTLERGRPSVFEEFGNVKGKFLFLDVHKAPFLDDQGVVIGTVGSARDITGRKQAEDKLHLAASVFGHAREGIMITNADASIIEVNEAFSQITGYSHDEVLGLNPRILNSGSQSKVFYEAMWRDLAEQGYWTGELWNRRKNGEIFAVLQTISAIRDDQGKTRQYVGLFSDITALKEHEQQLEHIAHYDALTKLPNRVLLADRLHQAMVQANRHGQPLAVAYLDLDGFKAVNDRYGHETGDSLLMELAARMKHSLREGDTLARLGGDEFVVVLLELADIEASEPLLTRLLEAAAQPMHLGEDILQVSASVGVTFYPQAEEVDADQLLRQADQAMYQAKLAGKNRYHVFDADQDRSVRGHHESLEHIRRALREREFVLYYQPKVNMRTGAIIGAEALIRWQHPEKGLLSPAVFLPVIEDHPLAVELGDWVVESALTQMDCWQAEGLAIPLSINVGARQLQHANFVENLRNRLAAHPQVDPSSLQLEVLETSALEDLAHVSKVIKACREIGVSFAMDDFGTGYSSLTYLKRFSVVQLKIDQSFVHDMLDDPEDLAILEGVLSLATAFRREVIAEGVETVEQGEMLLQLGCELGQGYGIARPMPADAIPDWFATWQPDLRWVNAVSVGRDNIPLLFASVEHRAWIVAIESCLIGVSDAPPPMDIHQCRFGLWLETEKQAGRAAQPTFQTIDVLHRRVHSLGQELMTLDAQGWNVEARLRLVELHALRNDLLGQLTLLVRESCRGCGV